MDTGNVCLVSIFAGNSSEDNSRICNISDSIKSKNKIIISSDFLHGKKEYVVESERKNDISYLHVPAYRKNLSFSRIYSHLIFAFKLRRYLKEITPASVYCAMPTSTAAYVCGKYCKRHGIKFVIDVIDLWPDSLIPVLNDLNSKLLKTLLFPWKYITVQAYKMADIILAESEKYAEYAAQYNKKAPVYPVYLGVDKKKVECLIAKCSTHIEKPNDEVWICYGGNLGVSYDFETLIKGVSVLNGNYKYRLLFVGDGVCRQKVEELCLEYSINVQITGFVDYGTFLKYLSFSDIAINIFKVDTKVVHSYKFNDYVATNCFVINSLSGETAQMVEDYKVGLNFDFKDHPFDKVLLECFYHWDKYVEWKNNNDQLIREVLDKNLIYAKIYKIFK